MSEVKTSGRRGQFESQVVSNTFLCREHYRLTLRVPAFPSTEPGQFVQVACRDLPDGEQPEDQVFEWSAERPLALDGIDEDFDHPRAVLRRPFSLAGRRDTPAGVELDVIHRVVGVGTDWLSQLAPGDAVGVLGPLGNRFTLPPGGGVALLVGGGVGIPPMIYLAEKLAGRKAVVFSGALTRDLLPLTIDDSLPPAGPDDATPRPSVAEFARHGIPTVLTTDDGSYGYRGFVTQALEAYLDAVGGRQKAEGREDAAGGVSHSFDSAGGRQKAVVGEGAAGGTPHSSDLPAAYRLLPTDFTIYTCGPEPMMKRVAEIAKSRGIACQVAVERAMACGMGTCQSCCIKVRKPDPTVPPLVGRDWCYRLACTDGPVFRGADLMW